MEDELVTEPEMEQLEFTWGTVTVEFVLTMNFPLVEWNQLVEPVTHRVEYTVFVTCC